MPDHTTKAVPAAMSVEKNVRIPMRDGVHLAADIYRPPAPGKVPALLALSPYGKDTGAGADAAAAGAAEPAVGRR